MKLPQLFKPKAPVLPVPAPADWIDHTAVQALQDQAEAALKINEPVERLVALKASISAVEDALKDISVNSHQNMIFYGHIKGPLTPEATAFIEQHNAKQMRNHQKSSRLYTGFSILGALGASLVPLTVAFKTAGIAGLFSGSAIVAAGFFGGLGAMFVPVPIILGLVTLNLLSNHKEIRALNKADKHMRDTPHPLLETANQLQNALSDIESSLTLAEARESSYLDAALDISPSLQTRFAAEATRAAIKGEAKPEDIRIITKPIRRDIAV